MNRKFWYVFSLSLLVLLAACGSGQSGKVITNQQLFSYSLDNQQHATPTTSITIPRQLLTPTPVHSSGGPQPRPTIQVRRRRIFRARAQGPLPTASRQH